MNQTDEPKPKKRTRRRRGREDGFHQRRGIWHFCLVIDGKRRFLSSEKRDLDEAREVFHEKKQALKDGKLTLGTGRKRFEAAADEYIADREGAVAEGTLRIEKERLPHLKRILGDPQLQQITPQTIRKYKSVRAKEVSPRTVNLELKLLRCILKAEGQWKRLADDDNVKPLPEGGTSVGRALTDEERARLLETAESNADWLVAYLCTVIADNTGMRGVELRNLKLADIDVESRKITIRKTKGRCGLGREVILTNDALKAAIRLMDRARAFGCHLPEHYLIPRQIKGGFDPALPTRGWRTAWRTLRKKAGLGGFRFHDLRHDHVTMHAELGTPLPVLQARVGHLSKKMTEHYTHVSTQAQQKATDAFEQAMRERLARVREKQTEGVFVQ